MLIATRAGLVVMSLHWESKVTSSISAPATDLLDEHQDLFTFISHL